MLVLSLLLTLCTPFAGFSGEYKVQAAKNKKSAVWSGEIDTSWYTGDKDSYDIYTAEELAGINKLCWDEITFEGITINLKSDIKLNDTNGWKKWGENAPKNIWSPIGDKEGINKHPFCGCFNGNGHTISGIYVDRTETSWWSGSPYDGGLFGFVADAVIENVKVRYSYISASGNAGAVVAASQNSHLIDVCAEQCIVRAGNCAGGIVGVGTYVDTFFTSIVAYALPAVLAGVVFNPLLFIDLDGNPKNYASTCLYNCVANNIKLVNLDFGHVGNCGGLVGGGGSYENDCVGIINSYVANITYDCTGVQGYLVAQICESNEFVEIKNSYWYNCKVVKTGKSNKFEDADSVTKVSEKTLHSKKFAEKLGNQFKYVKGKAPKCKMKFKNK